mmetsp:Transcript_6360/g.17755  ORF Transcript_6360/g.17755 Transcript_6360/m.17755 type:complete len:229 (+) Transcript_6360:126-812(+)
MTHFVSLPMSSMCTCTTSTIPLLEIGEHYAALRFFHCLYVEPHNTSFFCARCIDLSPHSFHFFSFLLCLPSLLYRQADNSRRHPRPGIARAEAELVPTAAAVVLAGINDDGPPNHAVRTDELHDAVLEGNRALPILGNDNVAQRPGLALFVCRGTVILAERVEDVAGRGGALGQIAGDVDGNAVLAGGEAADVALDGGRGVGGGLGQAEDAGHSGLSRDLARGRGGHG